MHYISNKRLLLRVIARSGCAVLIAALSAPVGAINGYFMNGYGPKANGVAGTSVAMPQDTAIAASNPAGMQHVAPGYDVYFRLMHPQRDARLDCRGIGGCDRVVEDASSSELFIVPGFSFIRRIGERASAGVTFYANGGLNTTFDRPVYGETLARLQGLQPGDPGFRTSSRLGVDLGMSITAFAVSYSVTDKLHVGISPLLSMLRFRAYGLQHFAPFSSDPTSLTNRGPDYVFGGGFRVGMTYELTPRILLGAQYTSEITHGKFTKYNGLFPNDGEFVAPRHYAIGVSWTPVDAFTVGVDVHQIQFATAAASGNAGPTDAEFANGPAPDRLLGGRNGFGFGWRNQTVVKAGAIYRHKDKLTLRLGYNGADDTTPSSQALFGLISPSAFRHHLTAGMSYRLNEKTEISWGYMHAFAADDRDPSSPLNGVPASFEFAGDAFDLGISRRF